MSSCQHESRYTVCHHTSRAYMEAARELLSECNYPTGFKNCKTQDLSISGQHLSVFILQHLLLLQGLPHRPHPGSPPGYATRVLGCLRRGGSLGLCHEPDGASPPDALLQGCCKLAILPHPGHWADSGGRVHEAVAPICDARAACQTRQLGIWSSR